MARGQDVEREREEYVLTNAGRELTPILAAIAAWGAAHRPTGFGPAMLFAEGATGQLTRIAFVNEEGRELSIDEVAIIRGPGATAS
jgi:hypothetical protein